jgi:hypothetical protein
VSSSAAIPLAPSHRNAPVAHRDRLADFTAGPRLLILSLMALVVGVISAFVARALVWLIGVFTNLAYYQRSPPNWSRRPTITSGIGRSWCRWSAV